MADENLTKRERQKQRRQQRLEHERAQAQSARRRRLAVLGLLALVVLAGVGFLVQRQLAERAELRRAEEEAAARQGEFGCGDVEQPPQQSAGHLQQDAAALAAAPPDQLYPDPPATSGQHHPGVVGSGVYDVAVDERYVVHNLEHGYVAFWYDEQADEADVQALKDFAEEQIEKRFPKIIVAEYYEPLPGEANFAAVAWGVRQLCESFDETIATAFLSQHYEPQAAPERLIPAHTEGNFPTPGEADEDVLLPPLAQGAAAPETPAPGDETASPAEEAPSPADETPSPNETPAAEPTEESS